MKRTTPEKSSCKNSARKIILSKKKEEKAMSHDILEIKRWEEPCLLSFPFFWDLITRGVSESVLKEESGHKLLFSLPSSNLSVNWRQPVGNIFDKVPVSRLERPRRRGTKWMCSTFSSGVFGWSFGFRTGTNINKLMGWAASGVSSGS